MEVWEKRRGKRQHLGDSQSTSCVCLWVYVCLCVCVCVCCHALLLNMCYVSVLYRPVKCLSEGVDMCVSLCVSVCFEIVLVCECVDVHSVCVYMYGWA